jgi:hypothetical protein
MRISPSYAFLALVLTLAGCAVTPHEPSDAVAETTPSALLADGDAALERGDLPAAATAYRRAAEASDDESVAEQATRVAFDNFQLKKPRAADPLARPQSDQRAGPPLRRVVALVCIGWTRPRAISANCSTAPTSARPQAISRCCRWSPTKHRPPM